MNREEVFQAVGEINDRFIAEAVRYAPEDAKRIITKSKNAEIR